MHFFVSGSSVSISLNQKILSDIVSLIVASSARKKTDHAYDDKRALFAAWTGLLATGIVGITSGLRVSSGLILRSCYLSKQQSPHKVGFVLLPRTSQVYEPLGEILIALLTNKSHRLITTGTSAASVLP